MTLHIDTGWLLAVQLTSMRLGALFVLAPGFGSFRLPTLFRVFLVLALSVALVSLVGAKPVVGVTNLIELLLASTRELIIGAAFAFALFVAFGAFLLGGRILDLQIGFGIATVIDPSTRTQSPLLGTILNLTAVAIFFSVNAHHELIRGIAYSLELHPLGAPIDQIAVALIIAQFGAMFSFGLAVVAPVIFCLLLVDVGMAFLARTMPQMNIFILTIPLKVFVGLVVLAASVPFLTPVIAAIFGSMFVFWQKLLT